MTAGRRAAFWWVTFAAVVTVGVTASLGVWQLGRASMKEALIAQRTERAQVPEVSLRDLLTEVVEGRWSDAFDRKVSLQGRWLHEATVFLDNRPMDGRSGFIVVTPVQVQGGGDALVLVQRGWVPRRFDDRGALPVVGEDAGLVTIRGKLAPPPSKLYELGQDSGGRIRQNVDMAQLAQELKRPVLPVSVLQVEPSGGDDGLTRNWPLVGGDAHKHLGYAFQWFGLSFVTVVLYVWFQIIVPRRRKR